MKKNLRMVAALGLGLCLGHTLAAEEPRTGAGPGPNPVPLTREDMKKALEDSKRSVPRLPLPPLSEEEKAKAAEASKDPAARTRGLGARHRQQRPDAQLLPVGLRRRDQGGPVRPGRLRRRVLREPRGGPAPAATRDRPSTTSSRR